MGNLITRPTVLEVDLQAFLNNIEKIKSFLPSGVQVMPVVKANGYGTYINRRLEVLNQFEIVAVATVDEGVFIRSLGYQKEIFVLNQPYFEEIGKIIESDLVVGISSDSFAKSLGEAGKPVRVHIEIGTGMGRTGINPHRALEYLESLASNIQVEGVYTHLSSADCDFEYTKKQLASFEMAVSEIQKKVPLKYVHSHASNAILNFADTGRYNLVRPGMIMYGYPSELETCRKIELEPTTKLKSRITFLKTVKEGTSIGYSRSFVTTKETKVATVPIGYADGLRRALSNKGEVVIHGRKAKIIGKICMDSFMVDVTDFDEIDVGDEVYIWDNENITLEEVAELCDTINYEILSCISARVPRVFKEEE
ncbi:MAG: alanine racemase [Clostridia bacterium]|nr:alanine racemase [Clostridia bacterium]